MAQTTYVTKPALAYQGMIADVGYDNVVVSRAAAAPVHVGVLVVAGTDAPVPPGAGQCQEIANSAAAIPGGLVGISLYDSTRMPYVDDGNGKAQYSTLDVVPVLTRGRVWVWTEVATAQTDPVFVRVLAAAANTKGQFTNATTANFIAWANARFLSSTSGAGLIVLEIR